MVDIILGLQWGDEGKGKIADFLTPNYDIVARFQGGPNAGHSLHFNGKTHVLNTIPSGAFHAQCINLIGNGVVIDPILLKKEMERTMEAGAPLRDNLLISKKAHLILPTHRLLDAASEAAKGNEKIGSTLRGIGPSYQDKVGRNGLRIGDIFSPNFDAIYQQAKQKHVALLSYYNFDYQLEELEQEFFESLEFLKEFTFVDSEYYINEQIKAGKKILAEGAQGSMLDIDFGTYPYVTSSTTISAGACAGLGIAPKHINKVFGIFKAYCTRVGGGPFPSELLDETGELLRKKGNEFGATTGRPRRCGWLDLVALKYAIMLSGVDEVFMMKADVMSDLETVKVGTGYQIDGEKTNRLPYDICHQNHNVLFDEFKGWMGDITDMKTYSELPETFKEYLAFVSKFIETPISIISVGPGREQTIKA